MLQVSAWRFTDPSWVQSVSSCLQIYPWLKLSRSGFSRLVAAGCLFSVQKSTCSSRPV